MGCSANNEAKLGPEMKLCLCCNPASWSFGLVAVAIGRIGACRCSGAVRGLDSSAEVMV